ncbi:MAG: hypothetical protein C3F07_12275 [Anaerolineales bacterium]|nr:MAG: hypothetical protein C3F07_12275 [Anaerolineales bacterium]
MDRRHKSIGFGFIFAGILICISTLSWNITVASAQDPVPTPTIYDPLAQPELPPDPTDHEMGRYLFWRHCMPCHGDAGQGLTEDFRALWGDHQNCWERGCHAGKSIEDSFPVPTIVPAVVREDQLIRFHSQEDLVEFLKATHPPQDPGFLEDEEYQLIAAFVFTMNHRPLDEVIAAPTLDAAPTSTPIHDPQMPGDNRSPVIWLVSGLVLLLGIFAWMVQKRKH